MWHLFLQQLYFLLDTRIKSMKNQEIRFTCSSCGKEAGCFLGVLPCEVLKDWLTVSCWKGLGSVEHYYFCSFSCLKSWVDTQIPKIPQVFIDSFNDDKN